MAIDARIAYDVWLLLISDEQLYDATIAGTHRELAGSRALGEPQLAVLDAFHAERGTRWNVENLRFRTALETRGILASYMPRTCRMLTNGDDNWLQDIAFEYLAFYRWHAYGHHRFTECERFATYVRDRIMKRRITPAHLDAVLDFELAVVRLLKHTAVIEPDGWPTAMVLDDDTLAETRLALSPASTIVDLPVDILDWVQSGDPLAGSVRPDPIALLVYVPSLQDIHKIKLLGEGPRIVIDQLTGERTVAAIATELEDEYGIERPALFGMLRGWLAERILAIA